MAREVSSISQIKSNILRPALTSQFIVQIPTPSNSVVGRVLSNVLGSEQEKLNLLCCETSLPGSSFATSEQNDDRTGVTERHAYRRIYDRTIDFSFYVDAEDYLPIKFFETWMSVVAGEDGVERNRTNTKSQNYYYRFRYPDDYRAKEGLKIMKFERDLYTQTKRPNILEDIVNIVAGTDFTSIDTKRTGSRIEYEFMNAFPIAINSMPVSYETSRLLKCTVSMSYTRYILDDISFDSSDQSLGSFSDPNSILSRAARDLPTPDISDFL